MKASQQSLKNWGDQNWRTKSGKKSSVTGERYLPEAAIKSLSPSEYAATTRAKRMGNMPGPEMKGGEPTRLLLSLRAWGASSKTDAKAKAAAISARNKAKK